jgi:opacity protein-like surface antigen
MKTSSLASLLVLSLLSIFSSLALGDDSVPPSPLSSPAFTTSPPTPASTSATDTVPTPAPTLATDPALAPAPAPVSEEERSFYVKGVFIGGATFGGKSNYTVTETGGYQLGTSSDTANSRAVFAGEWTAQSKTFIGGSTLIEGTRYGYTGGGPSDGELGFYLMPRLAQSFGNVEVWAGVGVGLMLTWLGGPTSATVGPETLTLNYNVIPSFAWTPRAGIDINLTSHFFIGAQYAYTRTTLSVPFSATGELITSGSENCTRAWSSAALRIGARY